MATTSSDSQEEVWQRYRTNRVCAMSPPDRLDEVRWELADLLDPSVRGADGAAGAGVDALLDEALERATAFAGRYRGALGELDGEGLAAAMPELAAIHALAGRAGSYAGLDFATDTTDP